MALLGPRLVIGGTHSGVGKTTVATGLMAALRHAGHAVASAKVGPDFIDPSYHALATGRPPRNLDAWMCGVDAIAPLAARAAAGADVLIVEGVMGLFDGAADGTPSSTADIATLLDAPIVLVLDASSMSGSVAALVSGYRDFRRDVRLAGVILNQVGSDNHELLLREALGRIGVEVFGALRRDDRFAWRDRHLGLVPVAERPAEVAASLVALAAVIAGSCDLPGLLAVAASAPDQRCADVTLPRTVGSARIAVAGGAAFTFSYPDNMEALQAAGADIVHFDPLVAETLPPDVSGLVLGGGFPEVYGTQLALNTSLLADVKGKISGGLVTWAECGGLLWLTQALDGEAMAAVLPAQGSMTGRLALGYRSATLKQDTPLGPTGTTLRGHEFHYSTVEPTGAALQCTSRMVNRTDGFATPTLLATYLHVHLGGDPSPAAHFVTTCVEL